MIEQLWYSTGRARGSLIIFYIIDFPVAYPKTIFLQHCTRNARVENVPTPQTDTEALADVKARRGGPAFRLGAMS